MPLPEGYLPREGDVLTVQAKVRFNVEPGEKDVHVRIVGDFRDTRVPLDKVVGITLRNWEEGDGIISLQQEGCFGIVASVHDEHVVMKLDPKALAPHLSGGLRIFHCNELLPFVDKTAGKEAAFDVAGAKVKMTVAPESAPETPTPILTMKDESDGIDF
jgi:hypothetical protein